MNYSIQLTGHKNHITSS